MPQRKDFLGTDDEYTDYAREAKKLTREAQDLATAARESKSREALRVARAAVKDASAMHTRAALSADAGGVENAGHLAHAKVLNELGRALLKVKERTR